MLLYHYTTWILTMVSWSCLKDCSLTVLASVCLRKISMKEIICRVLPRPMLCARMQPKPQVTLKRDSDSMRLSYKKRIPPICKEISKGTDYNQSTLRIVD